jgi:hemoglobin/transferrin/lactoferrin receptor protein
VESNGPGFTTSGTVAARVNDVFGVIGNVTFKDLDDYESGNGDTEPGTGVDVLGGMLKATLRPDENQELELGWIGQHQEWTEVSASAADRDTDLEQNTFTGKYEYRSPDNDWIDFHISGYLNDVGQDQVQLEDEMQYDDQTGASVVVPAGSRRGFDLQTLGFDVWNTSRFDIGATGHALTYGGDWFRDEVETDDSAGGGDVYTPSGERQAYGAFLQDQINYSDWLEIIGGLRFDGYSLDGNQGGTDVSADGTKLSPRLTVGVSPFERTRLHGLQVYGTYAEGYRSPAVTETLISGMHPSGVTFPFLPNPNLKPESATTYELGLNFSRDSLFRDEDRLRIKTAVFRNDVDDYIGLDTLTPGIFGGDPSCPYAGPVGVIPTVPPTYYPLAPYPYVPACYQYVNIAKVRIKGFEFEGLYDAGSFFTGLNVTLLEGEDLETGDPLLTIPPAQITGRLGVRLLDRRLIVGGEVQHVFSDDDFDEPFAEDYTLVNLFASYEASENFRVDLRVNNLFDETYSNYLNAVSGASVFESGFNAKLGATIRFGAS